MSVYDKTIWRDNTVPEITADQLNKIEDGLEAAHLEIDTLTNELAAVPTDASAQAIASLSTHKADFGNPHRVTARQSGGRHHVNAMYRGAKADGSTDNTALIQALLDELRSSGGGELYIPKGEQPYRCGRLLVPSKTRIVSDGAELFCTGPGVADPRGAWNGYGTGAPDTGGMLWVTPREQDTVAITDVYIEGLSILGAGDAALLLQGHDIKVVNVKVAGSFRDCVYINNRFSWVDNGPERILVEHCDFSGSKRNIVSLVAGKDVRFIDSRFTGCTGVPDNNEMAPGCGIELEPNATSNNKLNDILIRDCVIESNGGAGIGLVYDANGSPQRADNIKVLDNRIRFNGVRPAFGGGGNATVATSGGIFYKGGQADAQGITFVRGNVITDQVRGYGFAVNAAYYAGASIGKLILAQNDLVRNPAGAYVTTGLNAVIVNNF